LIYLFVSIFGLIIGSFINVCIYRIPIGESIAFPPSHCGKCKHKLSALDLVPVLSFIFLKRKCRYCGENISMRYPLVEILVSILFVLTYIRYGFSLEYLAFLVLLISLVIISFIDLDHKIIPNKMTLFIGILGIVFVIFGITVKWQDALLGLLVGGGILYLLGLLSLFFMKKEGMGGGDIKLLAVAGLYLGWQRIIFSLMISSYVALFIIGILLVFKKIKKTQSIPFGPFLSTGIIIVVLYYDYILKFLYGI